MVHCWMCMAPYSFLTLLILEKGIRLCSGVLWWVACGMASCWVGSGGQPVPCRFCGAPDSDGHLFWDCTFLPFVELRENPEFHDLLGMDKACWPECLLWHGWLA